MRPGSIEQVDAVHFRCFLIDDVFASGEDGQASFADGRADTRTLP
jgi:hypothetical protein